MRRKREKITLSLFRIACIWSFGCTFVSYALGVCSIYTAALSPSLATEVTSARRAMC